MELHCEIFYFEHHFLDEFLFVIVELFLSAQEVDSDDQFLENVVVAVVLIGYFFPFFELFLELEKHPECFGLDLFETGKKVQTQLFIIVIKMPQHNDTGNHQEQISIRTLYQLIKLLILL